MSQPHVNEVWVTKMGRECLIVVSTDGLKSSLDADAPNPNLAMLWWDTINKEWTVSPLMDRLDHRSETTVPQFFLLHGTSL